MGVMNATAAPAFLSLPERLAGVIAFVQQVLWRRMPSPVQQPVLYELVRIFHNRANLTRLRFDRLLVLARAGKLTDLAPRAPRAPAEATGTPSIAANDAAPADSAADAAASAAAAAARRLPTTLPPGLRFPRRVGWLRELYPDLRGAAGPLEYLLGDAEMEALFAAAPNRMRRLLDPLCRALAIQPHSFPIRCVMGIRGPQDPPLPRRPRRPRVRKPRTDLIDMHDGRFFTPAQFRRHLGLPSRKPRD